MKVSEIPKLKQKYHLERDGYVQFIVEAEYDQYEPGKISSVEFTVKLVNSWGEDKKPILDEEGVEDYMAVSIKFDGCSHAYFGELTGGKNGERNSYLHLCGAEYWNAHIHLMIWLYHKAEEIVPNLKTCSPFTNLSHLPWSERLMPQD